MNLSDINFLLKTGAGMWHHSLAHPPGATDNLTRPYTFWGFQLCSVSEYEEEKGGRTGTSPHNSSSRTWGSHPSLRQRQPGALKSCISGLLIASWCTRSMPNTRAAALSGMVSENTGLQLPSCSLWETSISPQREVTGKKMHLEPTTLLD